MSDEVKTTPLKATDPARDECGKGVGTALENVKGGRGDGGNRGEGR